MLSDSDLTAQLSQASRQPEARRPEVRQYITILNVGFDGWRLATVTGQ